MDLHGTKNGKLVIIHICSIVRRVFVLVRHAGIPRDITGPQHGAAKSENEALVPKI